MNAVRITLAPRVVPGQRIDAVDELKGLAIALVIFYHSGGVMGYPTRVHGEIGVDIFLILSGFTLAMNSVTMPLRQFFQRRFLRIYPSYWLALVASLLIQRKLFGTHRSWEDIWQHFVGIHGYSKLAYFTDISDPFWFISMIVAAYLVFACIRKRLDDLSLVVAVAGVLTLFATVAYKENGHVGGLISLAVRIPDFFVGVIAGRLLCAGTAELRFNLLLGLGLLCFYFQAFYCDTQDTYALPALGIIGTWLGLRHFLVKAYHGRVFLAAFALLGLISYEVYLFHQPLIRDYSAYVFNHVFDDPAPTKAELLHGIFAGIAVTLLISVAVHVVSESIWSRFKPRGASGQRAAA
jgi:peptidoglycan/LPS O-acetylase OafA/YrhL